jgi:hypothetical protein
MLIPSLGAGQRDYPNDCPFLPAGHERLGDYTSKCPRLGEGSLVFILMIAWTMAERLRSFVRMRPVDPCARSHER